MDSTWKFADVWLDHARHIFSGGGATTAWQYMGICIDLEHGGRVWCGAVCMNTSMIETGRRRCAKQGTADFISYGRACTYEAAKGSALL